jgi:transcriptional regulator
MYTPTHFREERSDVLLDFIRAHPLATVVTHTADGALDANHIPVLVMDENTLRGHVARGNAIWKAPDPQALAIFTAHDYYVSPSLYPSKQEHGRVVPTWNYSAVHVHGRLSFFDDRDRLRDIVDQLTRVHEALSEHPWAVTDAPAEYIDGLLGAIIGFDLKISRIEGKFKQSQNRSVADREAVRQRHPLR